MAADVDIHKPRNALEIRYETEKQIKAKKPVYMAYCCTVTI